MAHIARTVHTFLNPELHISVNKNRLKVYPNGRIYIKDGTEFQLEFYNKTLHVQKATIEINGTLENHALVLKPGEHYYLDRFMDVDKKLLFESYDVDNTPETKTVIKNNGLIIVKFYKESKNTYTAPSWSWSNSNFGYGSDITKKLTFRNTTDNTYDSSIKPNCALSNYVTDFNTKYIADTAKLNVIKTGRIEHGEHSNQTFRNVEYTFDETENTIFTYKLYPLLVNDSDIQVNTDDIRTYCSQCGRRIKKNWKFCSGCGTKI